MIETFTPFGVGSRIELEPVGMPRGPAGGDREGGKIGHGNSPSTGGQDRALSDSAKGEAPCIAQSLFRSCLPPRPALCRSSRPPQPEIRVERIAPGVAVLFGRGGNIGVSYGADGNILIDDQYAPATERVVAAVRTLDPDPIRYVINTHWHGDHTGGNENLGRAGTVIVAHDNVRVRMTMEQVVRGERVPPSPAGALPVITFSEDLTFHLNGDEIRAHHVDHAHTDGDSLIYWRRANVLHMGDTYFNGLIPFIDLDSGGSIDGAIAAVETGLAPRQRGDADHPRPRPDGAAAGPRPLSRHAEEPARPGRRGDPRRPDARRRSRRSASPTAYGPPDGFISPDAFVETVYASLSSPPAHSLIGAEHPREDRVDMLEMIVEVELRLDRARVTAAPSPRGSALSRSSSDSAPSDSHTFIALRWTRR